jgi:hypothetical protein
VLLKPRAFARETPLCVTKLHRFWRMTAIVALDKTGIKSLGKSGPIDIVTV